MSSANGSRRNGTRASSSNVTMVAWLMCWYMSMSDHRTCTGAGEARHATRSPFRSFVSCCGSGAPPPTASPGHARRLRRSRSACAAPAPPGSRWCSSHSCDLLLAASRPVRRRRARRSTATAATRRCRHESPTAPTNASGHRAVGRKPTVSSPSVPRWSISAKYVSATSAGSRSTMSAMSMMSSRLYW